MAKIEKMANLPTLAAQKLAKILICSSQIRRNLSEWLHQKTAPGAKADIAPQLPDDKKTWGCFLVQPFGKISSRNHLEKFLWICDHYIKWD